MQRGSKLWPTVMLGFATGVIIYTLQPDLNAAPEDQLPQPVVLPAQPLPAGQPAIQPAQPAIQPAGGQVMHGPKYTVIESQGVNLLVVDNTKNTLYFYTCDQNKEAGSDLKLRGSIDLNQVGQPVIRAKGHPTDEPGRGERKDRQPDK